MSADNLTKILTTTTERLSKPESHKELFHRHRDGDRLPSGKTLKEIIELSRSNLVSRILWEADGKYQNNHISYRSKHRAAAQVAV